MWSCRFILFTEEYTVVPCTRYPQLNDNSLFMGFCFYYPVNWNIIKKYSIPYVYRTRLVNNELTNNS